jgi:hypothetical protein
MAGAVLRHDFFLVALRFFFCMPLFRCGLVRFFLALLRSGLGECFFGALRIFDFRRGQRPHGQRRGGVDREAQFDPGAAGRLAFAFPGRDRRQLLAYVVFVFEGDLGRADAAEARREERGGVLIGPTGERKGPNALTASPPHSKLR